MRGTVFSKPGLLTLPVLRFIATLDQKHIGMAVSAALAASTVDISLTRFVFAHELYLSWKGPYNWMSILKQLRHAKNATSITILQHLVHKHMPDNPRYVSFFISHYAEQLFQNNAALVTKWRWLFYVYVKEDIASKFLQRMYF
jgi:hypothetical protein